MQINRLFEIVYILMDKKRITAGELAEHFEVSRRTILRDIDTLSMAGVPVYSLRGRGGGIAILENFVLDKTAISEKEQTGILIALQSMEAAEHIEISEVLHRLSALFNKQDRRWIEVDFSRWGMLRTDKEKFEGIRSALIDNHAIAYTYYDSEGMRTKRLVYPLKLIYKQSGWYLQAFCLERQGYRTFKVNRMQNIEALPEQFIYEDYTVPPLEIQNITRPANERLKLRFSPEAAYRLFDEFEAENVKKNKDDSYTVSLDMPNDEWLYGFLLSFGPYVKVLEPDAVREAFTKHIDSIRGLYDN